MKTFYMCYVLGKSSPTKRYASPEEALAEAQRLCESEKKPAYVLQAIDGFEPLSQSLRVSFNPNQEDA